MKQIGSLPFQWDKIDSAKIRRSAFRALIAFAIATGTYLFQAIDTSKPSGQMLALVVASFGGTAVKAGQRWLGDNSDDAALHSDQSSIDPSFR